MINHNDIINFINIAQKIEITKWEKEYISKFLKKIITYEDWTLIYSYLRKDCDLTWITWIQKTYELVSQVWEPKNIFHSLFALWVLADWKKWNIHPWLIEYVVHFIENCNEKSHIEYVINNFGNNTKIRETGERRLKEDLKENKK